MEEFPNKPLRIAMFSDSYFPILNGVSVSIRELIEELRRRGHSVHLYTSAYPKYKDDDPNIIRFPALMTPFAKGYPLTIGPFYFKLKQFRNTHFDIVHTHTPFTVGFVGMRWAESHELPLVSTYHTLYEKYIHYIPFLSKKYLWFKIAKHTNYYYNRCHHVIAPSEAAKNSLKRHGVKKPISIIPSGNPAPKKISKIEAKQQLGIREDEKVLLYVGRIAKEKNLTTLLEMAKIVFELHDDARLIFVGDGPYRKESQILARKLGIGDKTKFIGAIPRSEVDHYYSAADLFVFSSMTETQGLVIGEAMSFGVPAVAVHGGGASASIKDGENGFIVPNDVGIFVETVSNMLSNPALLGRLSENAKKSVNLWTFNQMCDAILQVYYKTLSENLNLTNHQKDKNHVDSRTN